MNDESHRCLSPEELQEVAALDDDTALAGVWECPRCASEFVQLRAFLDARRPAGVTDEEIEDSAQRLSEFVAELPPLARPPSQRRVEMRPSRRWMAVAAVLALALVLPWALDVLPRWTAEKEMFRGGSSGTTDELDARLQVLPSGQWLFEWTRVSTPAHYRVRFVDIGLADCATVEADTASSIVIDPPVVSDKEACTEIAFWSVEAFLESEVLARSPLRAIE